jgi:hypothetical protein
MRRAFKYDVLARGTGAEVEALCLISEAETKNANNMLFREFVYHPADYRSPAKMEKRSGQLGGWASFG